MTIGFWVKDTSGVDAELMNFIGVLNGDNPAFVLNWYSRLLGIEFRDSVQLRLYNSSVSVPAAGTWFHVAISWSTVDHKIRVYQDFVETITGQLPSVRRARKASGAAF